MGNSNSYKYKSPEERERLEKSVELDIKETKDCYNVDYGRAKYTILMEKYYEKEARVKYLKREVERQVYRSIRFEKQYYNSFRREQYLEKDICRLKQSLNKREHNRKLLEDLELEEIEDIPYNNPPPKYSEEGKKSSYTNY